MASRLKVRNNAVQPLLLMFPLGLFALGALFDLFQVTGAPAILGTLGYWNLVAGLIGGLVAALVGWIDAMLTGNPASGRLGALRFLLDLGVLTLFAVIVLLRMRTPDRDLDAGLAALEGIGLVLACFGAWFGGRLGETTSATLRPKSPVTRG
jgi:uncharacterized membrane protein